MIAVADAAGGQWPTRTRAVCSQDVGELRAVGAGALDADGGDLAVRAQPVEQPDSRTASVRRRVRPPGRHHRHPHRQVRMSGHRCLKRLGFYRALESLTDVGNFPTR
ncbi:hypothetical protein [Streptomyces sp. NPDC002889]|uniref:hypothetical protein n=1 Tax=Streptomyces sp. NPDC002889 TaxID=3364669 RepID=UPI0036CEC7AE